MIKEHNIMIKLIKNNASSFCIQMDAEGINETLKHLKNINEEGKDYLQIIYWGGENKLQIKLDTNTDEIRINRDMAYIYMDYEELEYFEQRLEVALDGGCFYPAEICERRYKNRYATLYCDIV